MARLAAAAAAASLLFDRCACTASPTLALGLNTSGGGFVQESCERVCKSGERGREGGSDGTRNNTTLDPLAPPSPLTWPPSSGSLGVDSGAPARGRRRRCLSVVPLAPRRSDGGRRGSPWHFGGSEGAGHVGESEGGAESEAEGERRAGEGGPGGRGARARARTESAQRPPPPSPRSARAHARLSLVVLQPTSPPSLPGCVSGAPMPPRRLRQEEGQARRPGSSLEGAERASLAGPEGSARGGGGRARACESPLAAGLSLPPADRLTRVRMRSQNLLFL